MLGNTLVVKHAPNVPQSALAFEKLFLDAGAPAGVYTNAFLSNEQAGVAIADKRIRAWRSREVNELAQPSGQRQARLSRRSRWNWAAAMRSSCWTMPIWIL